VTFVLDSKMSRRPSQLEAMCLPLSSDSLVLVRAADQLEDACTKRTKSLLTDNRNILNSGDTTDESRVKLLDVYREELNDSRMTSDTGKASSRLLNAMNSFRW